MSTYEELVARYGGQPIQFGNLQGAGAYGPSGPPLTYEELVRKYGGRPISFDGAGAAQASGGGEDGRAIQAIGGPNTAPGGPGSGAFGQGGGAGGAPVDPIAAAQARLRAFAEATPKTVPVVGGSGLTWTPEQLGQWAELSRQLQETVAAERAAGRRPGLLEQFGGAALDTIARVVGKPLDLIGASKDAPVTDLERAVLIGRFGLTPEQISEGTARHVDIPAPATPGEQIAQGSGAAAGYVPLGMVTSPLIAEGEAVAAGLGAGPTVARIAGQAFQELPFLPSNFEAGPVQGVINTLMGITGGAIGARAAGDIPAQNVLPRAISEAAPEPEMIAMYRGVRGPDPSIGDPFFTTNPERAASHGENVFQVLVPRDVYEAGAEAARRYGGGTAGDAILPHEYAVKARPSDFKQKIETIDVPEGSIDLNAEAIKAAEALKAPEAGAGGARAPGPPSAGGGLPYKPLPRDANGNVDLPAYINENLNTKRLDVSDDALQEMYTTGRVYGLDIRMAKGQPRPHDLVRNEASALLRNPREVQKLLNKPHDYVYKDYEGFALRQIYAGVNRQAAEASDAFNRGLINEEQMIDALRAPAELEMRRAAGAASAGRALGAMNMIADGRINPDALKKIAKYVSAMGGKDAEKITAFIKQIEPKTLQAPNFWDKLHFAWINALVSASNPINAFNNAAEYLFKPVHRAFAAGLDVPIGLIPGRTREVRFREAVELAKFHGLGEALSNGWKYLKTGISESPGKTEKAAFPDIGGIAGATKWYGVRPLGAVDEVFHMLNYSAESHAQAFRQAASEGLKGQALAARAATILARGSDVISHRASLAAKRGTFTDTTLLGEWASRIANMELPIGGGKTVQPLRWIVPFTRVGSSVLTKATELSPAGFAVVAQQRLRGIDTGRALAEDLATPTIGTLLGLTAWWLKEKGILTGASRPDANERNTLQAIGWQPDSIRVGDKYISIARYEPLGKAMLLMSHSIDAFDRGDDAEGEGLATEGFRILKDMGSDTWYRSVSDLMEILNDETTARAEKFAARTAAGFVPNVIRRGLKEFGDTTQRKTTGFADTLAREVGINVAEPRLSPFGKEVGKDKPAFDRLASFFGMQASTAINDPIIQEHIRLGAALGVPGTAASAGGGDELPDKELFKDKKAETLFRKAKGRVLYEADKSLMDGQRYQRADDNEKMTMLRRVRQQAAAEFNQAWRRARRPMDEAGLNRLRINVRRVAGSAANLRGIELTEADIMRFMDAFGGSGEQE